MHHAPSPGDVSARAVLTGTIPIVGVFLTAALSGICGVIGVMILAWARLVALRARFTLSLAVVSICAGMLPISAWSAPRPRRCDLRTTMRSPPAVPPPSRRSGPIREISRVTLGYSYPHSPWQRSTNENTNRLPDRHRCGQFHRSTNPILNRNRQTGRRRPTSPAWWATRRRFRGSGKSGEARAIAASRKDRPSRICAPWSHPGEARP